MAARRPDPDADAVLAACRLLVGVSVRSLAAVEDEVDVVQLRVLTVLASRGPLTLSDLASATGLHLSRASRMCDRLVAADLVARESDPDDRRSLSLTLTARGRRVVTSVYRARRDALEPALRKLSAATRRALVDALGELTAAAGVPAEADLWALGWTTSPDHAEGGTP